MNYTILENLLSITTPSSYENECLGLLEIPGWTECYSDKMKNKVLKFGNGPIKVLLSGHCDEICFAVNYITDEGYIVLSDFAGGDYKTLPGAQVVILSEDCKTKIPGVVCSQPIHAWWHGDNKDKAPEEKDLKVSIGAESKEEVNKLGIYPGCLVVFKRNINMDFGPHQIHGNALDDKVGCFIVREVAKGLAKSDKYTYYCAWTTQEESGLRGSKVLAKNLNADISIDLDVTIATDGDLGLAKEEYGEISLGKGPVIEFGQDKSRRIALDLIQTANTLGIKIQRGLAIAGGTNTSVLQTEAKDCETALISLPCLNLHTPNEICDKRDIENTIILLENYLNLEKL